MDARIGNGGWLRLTDDELDGTVYARLDELDGRLVVVDVFVLADVSVTAAMLRRVPVGRVEAWANSPGVRDSIRARLSVAAPDLRTAASFYATTFGDQAGDHWVVRMMDAQRAGSDEPQQDPEPEPVRRARRRQARLPVPSGRRYPDSFYQRVAEVYADLAHQVDRPAGAIAEANDVPVTTVHRWVKESRRRGFLGAGRKGVAG